MAKRAMKKVTSGPDRKVTDNGHPAEAPKLERQKGEPGPGAAMAATTRSTPAASAEATPPKARPKCLNVIFALLEPGANHVSLSGDFNGWSSKTTPMKRHEDGHWEISVALAPGRYQYKFVVDGQWIPDPLARENILNPHGTLNSVLEVRG